MEDATASRTALGVSLVRAVHARTDPDPVIVDDWGERLVPAWARDAFIEMALAQLAPEERARIQERAPETILAQYFPRQDMYGNVVMRARWAEDALADAVADGVRQYVILGAGFDSFALRRPAFAEGLDIIEVDHPATQDLKREQLRATGIGEPAGVRFIAADFTRETLGEVLSRAGLDREKRVFFSWLGVVSYLTREENHASLRAMAECAPGSLVAFSYLNQSIFAPNIAADRPEGETMSYAAGIVRKLGEPFVSGFDPDLLPDELDTLGWELIEDLNGPGLAERYGRVGARALPTATASRFALARVKG
jgi:methyltransferase (TIGR00027 family)